MPARIEIDASRDCGDFPVHNKSCLWIKVEKSASNLAAGVNHGSGILRLDVNPVHSFAQPRKKFIRNGSRHL